ncbi:MAG: gamma-glutamyltransferase [Parvibaculaceae bacterium]|nr:gamma-glutamyltransferase [Parvibaculaceae bacterium]
MRLKIASNKTPSPVFVERHLARPKKHPSGLKSLSLSKALTVGVLAFATSGLTACVDTQTADPFKSGTSLSSGRRAVGLGTTMGGDGASLGGLVIAEEPTAALIARSILEKGGSAADAATALYFGLSVTMPAAAGLGGGGICITRNAKDEAETIEFLPRSDQPNARVTVPANVRGFALVHAKMGRLTWGENLTAAETIASTGQRISRATARHLKRHTAVIAKDAYLKSLSLKTNGSPLTEQDRVVQPDLANTLGLLRSKGPIALYGRKGAAALRDAAATAGLELSSQSIRQYRGEALPVQMVDVGNNFRMALPAATTAPGAFAAKLLAQLHTLPAGNNTAIAEALATSEGIRVANTGAYASTGFLVVDAYGQAVACAVGMNGPFGSGHTAPGYGFTLATTSTASGHFMTPLFTENVYSKQVFFAGVGTGGPAATAAVLDAERIRAVNPEMSLKQVISLSHGAGDDARVSAASCPGGFPRAVASCDFAADPAGDGLVMQAQRRR